MTTTPNHNLKDDARSVRSVLHSRVYLLLVGFALWFALAVWGFAGGGLSNYLLVIVSGFISIVVALQLILSRVGRTERAAQNDDNQPSLRDWAAEDFDTWQGRLSGGQAALQILLPDCCGGVGHDGVRHRVCLGRTRRHLALQKLRQLFPCGQRLPAG